ncbi:MAG: HEAT repeat domain-containing protein [Chloroflexota bacterium]
MSTADLLASLRDDPRPEVRTAAARSFTCDSDPAVAEGLSISATLDESPDVRSQCLYTLRYLGDWKVLPLLIRVLADDSDPNVRAAAAIALGSFPSTVAMQALRDAALNDPDGAVRQHSAWMLGKCAIDLTRMVRDIAVPALRRVARDPGQQEEARGAAIEQLIGLRDRTMLPSLERLLEDPSAVVRYWACYALGLLGGPDAVPSLQRVAASASDETSRWGNVGAEALNAIETIHLRFAPRR